jgi:hypothetical protein
LTRFLITAILVTAVIIGGGYGIFEVLPSFFYQTIILLFISTAGLYRFLLNIKQKNSDLFVPIYLATFAIKLIAFGAYIFVMIKQDPGMMMENVAFFLVVYVIFTALETVFLYRVVNR